MKELEIKIFFEIIVISKGLKLTTDLLLFYNEVKSDGSTWE
jgi:hypothetical protein